MSQSVELFTFDDGMLHLGDFDSGRAADSSRQARRAMLSAYRKLAIAHTWSYYYGQERINTVAAVTGTLSYIATGSTFEREYTIDSGSWPTWAADGTLIIDDTHYEIAERKSGTVLTGVIGKSPTSNLATGEAFTLYRDSYPFPADFLSADEIHAAANWLDIQYVHPREWHWRTRHITSSGNTPYLYTIMKDDNYLGVLSLKIYPYPDQAYALDFVYRRRPKPLSVEREATGTVTVSSGSTTVNGSNTAFTDKLVGSLIRVADVGDTATPTGREGANPFTEERIVMSVTNATTLEVDNAFSSSLSGVKYVCSSPLDIEPGVMLTAFLRLAELEYARFKKMAGIGDLYGLYKEDLLIAKEADQRYRGPRQIASGYRHQDLGDMPAGADIE